MKITQVTFECSLSKDMSMVLLSSDFQDFPVSKNSAKCQAYDYKKAAFK